MANFPNAKQQEAYGSRSKAMTVNRQPASHRLQHTWNLFYCKIERDKRWEDCMQKAASFSTVEDFWSVYNHIQPPSGLMVKTDYYLFKDGIQPMWEDPVNISGGRWLLHVKKFERERLLDHFWLELILALLGEQFDECSESICGAVVNIRPKGDKISCWVRSHTSQETIMKIGSILKKKLGLKDDEKISYEIHQDLALKSCSTLKPALTL